MIEWCGLIIVAPTRVPRYLSFDVLSVNVDEFVQSEAIPFQAPSSDTPVSVLDHGLGSVEMRHCGIREQDAVKGSLP